MPEKDHVGAFDLRGLEVERPIARLSIVVRIEQIDVTVVVQLVVRGSQLAQFDHVAIRRQ
jgi:hypothetical protein